MRPILRLVLFLVTSLVIAALAAWPISTPAGADAKKMAMIMPGSTLSPTWPES